MSYKLVCKYASATYRLWTDALGGTRPYTFHCDFGDGQQTTLKDNSGTRHTYENPGTYTATVTVTDATGQTASYTTQHQSLLTHHQQQQVSQQLMTQEGRSPNRREWGDKTFLAIVHLQGDPGEEHGRVYSRSGTTCVDPNFNHMGNNSTLQLALTYSLHFIDHKIGSKRKRPN
jgi:hypothetical protein